MKLKTHSGAKKRVKTNSKGRMFTRKAGRRHLLINKSKRQKKLNQKTGKPMSAANIKATRKLLPNN